MRNWESAQIQCAQLHCAQNQCAQITCAQIQCAQSRTTRWHNGTNDKIKNSLNGCVGDFNSNKFITNFTNFKSLIVLFTDFNVGNGPAEDVEAEHQLEFQFALFLDDQSDLDFLSR